MTKPPPMFLPEEVAAFGCFAPRRGARWYRGIQFFKWRHLVRWVALRDKRVQLQGAFHRWAQKAWRGRGPPVQKLKIRALTFLIRIHILRRTAFRPFIPGLLYRRNHIQHRAIRNSSWRLLVVARRRGSNMLGLGLSNCRGRNWFAARRPPENGFQALKSRALAAQSQAVGRGWRSI